MYSGSKKAKYVSFYAQLNLHQRTHPVLRYTCDEYCSPFSIFFPTGCMVNMTKSDAVKACIKQEKCTEALCKAQIAWEAEQRLPKGVKRRSMRTIATEFSVPQQTLSDHVNGKHRFQIEASESLQKLSPQQENALVELIQKLDEGAMPAG
jgi:hypothetical protein